MFVNEKLKKKTLIIMALCVLGLLFLGQYYVHAEMPKITAEIYWGNGCSHCEEIGAFLHEKQKTYKWLDIKEYEVFDNADNSKRLDKILAEKGLEFTGVPVVLIADKIIDGYGYNTKNKIEKYLQEIDIEIAEKTIKDQSMVQKPIVQKKMTTIEEKPGPKKIESREAEKEEKRSTTALTEKKEINSNQEFGKQKAEKQAIKADENKSNIEIPFLGNVNPKNYSLPLLTLIIAGVDSLNPCAFFILLSLMGLLVHAQSKGRMLLIGGIFVFSSGLMYFLFMVAWLNLFMLMSRLTLITIVAGIIAIILGIINIKDYFIIGRGVTLSMSQESRLKLFAKMRDLVKEPSIIGAILGAIVLAQVANLYEFLCTAGFPMIYARVLTMNELTVNQYYSYIALYNVVYVLPLAIIVIIFSNTLGRCKLSTAQIKSLKLVSGSMMLGMGMFLTIAPDLLNSFILAVAIIVFSVIVGLFGYKIEKKREIRKIYPSK